jgi:hypothetical protein
MGVRILESAFQISRGAGWMTLKKSLAYHWPPIEKTEKLYTCQEMGPQRGVGDLVSIS